jgi:hypothetical protein
MDPKRKNSGSSDAATPRAKRQKRVMNLNCKLQVLDRLGSGESAASVGKVFGVNESTIRYIKKNGVSIRTSIGRSTATGNKVTSRTRDPAIEKMEKALSIWIEDQSQKKVPLTTLLIKAKAIKLFEHFKGDADTIFLGSKGWFENFKKRQSLHNIKVTGEAASADTVAAAAYPAELKEHIEEKGYLPEQVFNADETGLFWKKMPARTFISTQEKAAPGFKAAKDRVTLLLCANASGDCMIKPMMLHRAYNPHALKGKNKEHLPVFWRANKKAWVTAAVFLDWFNNCFVHEVKHYLASKNLDFKVLLLLDNAPGHPQEDLQFAHPNIEVRFLPPNTTSILQPMDQGIIATFKAYYTRRTFKGIVDVMDLDEELTVTDCWKKYDISQCITNIKESVAEITQTTLNACWKNLWPQAVNNFTGFPNIEADVQRIAGEASRIRGIGAVNVEDVQELLKSHAEELTEEELEEFLKTTDDEADEEEPAVVKPKLTMKDLDDLFKSADHLINTAVDRDPFMVRSLKFKRQIESVMAPYKEIRQDLVYKAKQTSITSFFTKSPPASSTPSTSGISSAKPSTSGIASAKPSTSGIASFFRIGAATSVTSASPPAASATAVSPERVQQTSSGPSQPTAEGSPEHLQEDFEGFQQA